MLNSLVQNKPSQSDGSFLSNATVSSCYHSNCVEDKIKKLQMATIETGVTFSLQVCHCYTHTAVEEFIQLIDSYDAG